MAGYRVNIVGLSNNVHTFRYEIDDAFFSQYGKDLVSAGSFRADVVLNKTETMIAAGFEIHGRATLICDRSLEPFDFPIDLHRDVIFKYGELDEELSDEIVNIRRDTVQLEIGQYIYEFISLEVPMKKLHPRFRDEELPGEGKIVYSSGDDAGVPEEPEDPRWDILKKLK
ncbi:MAG TPA: DUF177 domain-containing protein [Cyclobacteriaceae bacterium]|nr:DUF177 domain-containing protein [Cyclobacteriaceae bacterium]